jgi:hypothetical protein
MTVHRYDLARGTGGLHTATRGSSANPLSDGSKAVLDITLTDNPADTETIIFGGVTWTFKTVGVAANREVTIAGTKELTAAAAATNISAHATDGLVYAATNPSGAIIRLTPAADSATIAQSAFGTADQSRTARSALNTAIAVPLASNGVTLIVDDSVVSTKIGLLDALRALLKIIRKDFTTKSTVASLATSGTVTD